MAASAVFLYKCQDCSFSNYSEDVVVRHMTYSCKASKADSDNVDKDIPEVSGCSNIPDTIPSPSHDIHEGLSVESVVGEGEIIDALPSNRPLDTVVWSQKMTQLLIALLKERRQDFKSKFFTKKQTYQKVSLLMAKSGYTVTWLQIQNKMKALMKTYKSTVDNNKGSGNSRKSCRFEDELAELCEDDPSVTPLSTASSSGGFENQPSTTTTPRSRANPTPAWIKELLSQNERMMQMQERHHEERMKRQDRLLGLLEGVREQKK